MKVLVLGGDGYIGWPVALSLADQGHVVSIFDSLAKRKWEMESGSEPLLEVMPLHRRTKVFQDLTGKKINFFIGDITNVGAIYHIFDIVQPDAVVHCAGQPSAPFSMLNRTNAVITQENNYIGTLNILFAIQRARRNIHLLKLGSVGAYSNSSNSNGEGCPGLGGNIGKDEHTFSFWPRSYYHLSEVCASQAMFFTCKNWELRITELRLGVVYGMESRQTVLAPQLNTSFHYDAVFGSCPNRFAVQAAIGHPLTVFGQGEQKEAFLCLSDVVKGVELALGEPPEKGDTRVINHYAQVLSIRELAETVQTCAKKAGLVVETQNVPNPRLESENGPYRGYRENAGKLGLSYETLAQVFDEAFFMKILQAKDRIDMSTINKYIHWRKH